MKKSNHFDKDKKYIEKIFKLESLYSIMSTISILVLILLGIILILLGVNIKNELVKLEGKEIEAYFFVFLKINISIIIIISIFVTMTYYFIIEHFIIKILRIVYSILKSDIEDLKESK